MLHCKFERADNDESTVYQCAANLMLPFRKHLQEATVIASIHKDSHPAKYARCLFKLSEALRQVLGQETEADQRLKEAKDLYSQITGNTQATNVERQEGTPLTRLDRVKEEDFDALIHISQR